MDRRHSVLVVDDDEGIRESLVDVLTDAGYPVHAVEHGAQAVEYLRSAEVRPCVVLLDLMMPVMDGWRVLEHIRSEQLLEYERIIVMTAQRDPELPADIAAMTKPVSVKRVLEVVGARCPQTDPAL